MHDGDFWPMPCSHETAAAICSGCINSLIFPCYSLFLKTEKSMNPAYLLGFADFGRPKQSEFPVNGNLDRDGFDPDWQHDH